MKTNLYIALIFLFTFAFGTAQSTADVVKVEINKTVSVENTTTIKNKTKVILINASEVKESIARSSSDIRLYFNRLRNVDNLSLLFPKINKAVKA